MASSPRKNLSEYPRPWFYRPEMYYGMFIFPPAWSVLTLRSPWHNAEGFRGIMVGGIAWFIIIASVVLSVRWVQEGGVRNLFIFVPGILLTLLTQVQWTAHRAHHGPPPTETEDEAEPSASVDTASGDGDEEDAPEDETPSASPPDYTPRRRRRRRRRPISRSADSTSLC